MTLELGVDLSKIRLVLDLVMQGVQVWPHILWD